MGANMTGVREHRQTSVISDAIGAIPSLAAVVIAMAGVVAAMLYGKDAWHAALGISPEDQLIEAAARGDIAAMSEAERRRGGFDWDRDDLGAMAMVAAIARNQEPALQWLLDHGMPVDQKDRFGKTPLIHACCNGQMGIARMLLLRSADTHHRDVFGRSAADYLAAYAKRSHIPDDDEALRSLMEMMGRM